MNKCPWCGARAIDITTHNDLTGFDRRPRFMCAGKPVHEWRDGDGIVPEQHTFSDGGGIEPKPEPEHRPGIWSRLKSIFRKETR